MPKPKILFFEENVDFKLPHKKQHKDWLVRIAASEKHNIKTLNYVFADDAFVLQINQQYLQHDTYTDIITFDNSIDSKEIEGEIYISVERVLENSNTENTTFDHELRRVMVHGLLHLCGYDDKTEEDIIAMRKKEDLAIDSFVNA